MFLKRSLAIIQAKFKIPLYVTQIDAHSVMKNEKIRWCRLHLREKGVIFLYKRTYFIEENMQLTVISTQVCY